jgi:hypothetical protein
MLTPTGHTDGVARIRYTTHPSQLPRAHQVTSTPAAGTPRCITPPSCVTATHARRQPAWRETDTAGHHQHTQSAVCPSPSPCPRQPTLMHRQAPSNHDAERGLRTVSTQPTRVFASPPMMTTTHAMRDRQPAAAAGAAAAAWQRCDWLAVQATHATHETHRHCSGGNKSDCTPQRHVCTPTHTHTHKPRLQVAMAHRWACTFFTPPPNSLAARGRPKAQCVCVASTNHTLARCTHTRHATAAQAPGNMCAPRQPTVALAPAPLAMRAPLGATATTAAGMMHSCTSCMPARALQPGAAELEARV